MKRIPEGSEAAAVLVGAVDFLEQPTTAFVRLSEGILMPSVTEVSLQKYFVFYFQKLCFLIIVTQNIK